MPIDRLFVLEEQFFIGAVRDRHDVDVAKFRARLPPVAVRQDVMPADFAPGFHFASSRHRPMEKRVETRDAHTARRRFDVLEKSRETSDDLPRVERFRDPIEFIRSKAGFPGAR